MNPAYENMNYYPSQLFLQALPYEASKPILKQLIFSNI